MGQIPLVLLLALQTMGISVSMENPNCRSNSLYMGEFIPVKETLVICSQNAKAERIPVERVVRHEIVHAIHQRFRLDSLTLTPEPLFTVLVQKHLPSEEVLSVLAGYDKDLFQQEIEARLLEKVMTNDQLASLGTASQAYYDATKP